MKNIFKVFLCLAMAISATPALAQNVGLNISVPVSGTQNVIYGNNNGGSGTQLMLLQSSGVNRFFVETNGNVTTPGTIYASGGNSGQWNTASTHASTDADTNASNEIQTLGTSGNNITLTSGGSVQAPYATNAGNATTVGGLSTSAFLRAGAQSPAGNAEIAASDNGSYSYSVAGLELRETNYGGSGSYLPPRLAFHWGGVVASQLTIESDGKIAVINNPGTGYENFRANNFYSQALGAWLTDRLGQDVRSGASPTFGEVYTSGWFRNNDNNEGLYNQNNGNHWYSDGTYWKAGNNNSGAGGIQLRYGHEGALKGYVYWDGSGFGLLHSGGGWGVMLKPGSDQLYIPGNVGIGTTDTSSYKLYARGSNGSDWLYRFNNDYNSSNVHMLYGAGYGIHVNAGTNAGTGTYIFEGYGAGASRFYVNGVGDLRVGASSDRYVDAGRLYLNNSAWHSWGTSIIDGRVWSANSNIHLSPPNGGNVVINTDYRDAGGSAGTAGLTVSGNGTFSGGTVNVGSGSIVDSGNNMTFNHTTWDSWHEFVGGLYARFRMKTSGTWDGGNSWVWYVRDEPNPHKIRLISDNTGTEVMTIDQNGNIGLGDTTPDSRLHIYGGDNSIRGAYGRMMQSRDEWLRLNDDDEGQDYHTSGVYVDGPGMGIQNGLGVGTSDHTSYRIYGQDNRSGWGYRLNNNYNGSNIHIAHGGGYGIHVNAGTNASSGTYLMELYGAGATRMYVRGDGNVGIGDNVTSPANRLEVRRYTSGSSWQNSAAIWGFANDANGGSDSRTVGVLGTGQGDGSIEYNAGVWGEADYAQKNYGLIGVAGAWSTAGDNYGIMAAYGTYYFPSGDFSGVFGGAPLVVDNNLGVGTFSPSYKLHVVDASTYSDNPAIYGQHQVTSNYGVGVRGDGGWVGVWGQVPSDGWTDFYAAGKGNYSPFTGSHDVRIDKVGSEMFEPGMLVVTTGDSVRREDNYSTTLPKVSLSSKAKDPTVIGVFVKKGNHRIDWYSLKEDEVIASVNALGEGVMWVTNYGGDIKNGDLLTTSPIPGMGMMQDDDLMHSYTVGKSTQSVDWGSVTDTITFDGKVYKKVLITVTYHAG